MNQPCNYTTTGGVQDAQESQACQTCQQPCPPPPCPPPCPGPAPYPPYPPYPPPFPPFPPGERPVAPATEADISCGWGVAMADAAAVRARRGSSRRCSCCAARALPR